jgi:hypothetical protein
MSGPGRYNSQQQQPRQYATLYSGRNNGSYSPVHGAGYATMTPGVGKGSNPVKAKLPHNYAGTMLGNGGSGNGVRSTGGKHTIFHIHMKSRLGREDFLRPYIIDGTT